MNNPITNTDPSGLDCCSHPQVSPGLIGGDEFDMMGIPAGPPTLIGFTYTTEIFIDPDTGAESIIPIGANAIYDPGMSAGADFADIGPDPVAVANSMRQYTTNTLVYGPLQQLKSKVVGYFCGSSPSGAIENWMETGATKGAIGGAIAGGGVAGVASFGFGGVPGAILGGTLGSVAGAGGGVLFGGMAAATCSAAGVYGSGS